MGDVVDTNLEHLKKARLDTESESDESDDERVSDRTDANPFAAKLGSKPEIKVTPPARDLDETKAPHIVDSEYYDMTHPHRGIALILNHKYFNKMSTRQGTTKDCKDIEQVLKMLGFEPLVCVDYTRKDVLAKVNQISKMDHTHFDCLVIVAMTHGEPGKLYAKDDDYHLSELWEPFVGDNCPSLIGKPKLVFLQACRGDKMDRGSTARLATFASDAVDGQPTAGPVVFSIPTMADVLIMYATFDDHYAWRNPKDGSWFIQSLCKEFVKNPHESLATLLTNVTRRVAFQYQSNVPDNANMDGMKQIPCTVSMLTKSLYFTRKGPVRMEEH